MEHILWCSDDLWNSYELFSNQNEPINVTLPKTQNNQILQNTPKYKLYLKVTHTNKLLRMVILGITEQINT